MKTIDSEAGGVLVTALLVGLLLSMLGGVAMNLAVTETVAEGRHLAESASRILAESGVEEVVTWFTHADLPASVGSTVPSSFRGTAAIPDVDFNATRPEDDRLLNDRRTGAFRALAELGRILRFRLYGAVHPEGLCTIEVTAEDSHSGVRRTVSLELGAIRIPPLHAALQAGLPASPAGRSPRALAHWGDILLAGDAWLGRSDRFPRTSDLAEVTGLGYDEPGAPQEDRWMEAWIGGTPQFEDLNPILPPNVHANQDPAPGLPPSPWQYQKFKELAMRFGTYYVPDREGRLYRNGMTDPALAQTPAEVFGSFGAGAHKGLVFVDTLDQAPPSTGNLATLVLDSAYMEGIFYVNAHVVLKPDGMGQTIPALSPPPEVGSSTALRVPVSIADVRIQGVLHVTGSLHVENQTRVFGAVVAEGGLNGGGSLEVWYNHDLERGLVQGLPTIFPIRGTWREWGS